MSGLFRFLNPLWNVQGKFSTRKVLGDLDAQVHEVTLVGNPAQNIVEFASSQKADLVVTGTHGHSPGVELCLGSVSNAVAHRALCPVLIVR